MADNLHWELLAEIRKELRGHTWQFDAQQVAEMLSPKRLPIVEPEPEPDSNLDKYPQRDDEAMVMDGEGEPVEEDSERERGRWPREPVPPKELAEYEHHINHPVVQKALRNVELPRKPKAWFPDDRRKNLEPLTKFLNDCLARCYTAYDSIFSERTQLSGSFDIRPRDEIEMRFIIHDSWAKGEFSSPIKLEVCGIHDWVGEEGNDSEFDCHWTIPNDCEDPQVRQIGVAVQLDDDWERVVLKAGTHARAAFDAIVLRQFVLVIGVNTKEGTIRFLTFHRGGLSANRDLRIDDVKDRFEIMKLLLSVVLWQDKDDAGIVDCNCKEGNGHRHLHINQRGGASGVLLFEDALYHKPSLLGKNTYIVQANHKIKESGGQTVNDGSSCSSSSVASQAMEVAT